MSRIGASGGLLCVLVCSLAATAVAAEPQAIPAEGFPRAAPLSPADAVRSFRVQRGFQMQLVAAEPLLMDPVDVCYDADGRAYVVEMRGYPLPEKPEQARPEPISRVRMLFDDDGDGVFDRSTVFVDKLDWPTAVCPFRSGVFILDAPDLWFAEDTNGDGVADERRKVLTGFQKTNVQALANNLKWGLDGWIYGAASGNGGELTVVSRPSDKPVSVSRRDFRFHPWTETVEAISGGARFGHSFDDWGHRFLCNIRNPIQHVVLPLAAINRNPFLVVPTMLHDAAASGETLPVYRISPVEPWREFRARRWVQERVNYPRSELVGAGFFTSSSGVTIYRGGAYSPEFQGQAFVADVAANVVHRETLEPDGVTFRARRVDDDAEFVASTDIWFRPVNFVNAPDGTLHVVDMYREYIEHPWSIPDDIRAKLDLTSGNDRGRIWRLAPPKYSPTAAPRLSRATTDELVRHLRSPHSWWRETAHRLLLERQDQAAITGLQLCLTENTPPQTRLHALWLLDGLGALRWADVLAAGRDAHPAVREHAVQLAERRFADEPEAQALLLDAARDAAIRVRFRAALALGRWSEGPPVTALAEIARRDGGDPWMRAAVGSAASQSAATLVEALWRRPEFADRPGAAALLETLARTAAARDDAAAARVAAVFGAESPTALLDLRFALANGWLEGVQRRGRKLADILRGNDPTSRDSRVVLAQFADVAVQVLRDPAADLRQRVQALPLLSLQPLDTRHDVLRALWSPQQPRELQLAAVRALGRETAPETPPFVIGLWRTLTPAVRAEAVDWLASRPTSQPALLAAIEAGTIAAADVPPSRRTLLLNHRDAALKARAEQLFGPTAPSSRQAALDAYQESLRLKADAAAGLAVFKRECSQCHKLQGVGFEIGPPLASIRNRSPEELLTHILDPNREVGPNYYDYAVTLQDGRVATGLLTNETDAGLTLLRPQGVQEQLARRDVDELASTGKSLMPEGLEQRITRQEMADLIAALLKP